MSGRWWRAYSRARHDPKLQKLSGDLFKSWFNLVCLAGENDGIIPLDNIAYELRMSEAKAKKTIRSLVDAGLFDKEEQALTPHNWDGLQYKSDTSADRMRRHRERHRDEPCDVTSDGPVTRSETEADTDTETEAEQSRADTERAFALFNDAAKRTGWPAAQKIDDTRKKKMLARLKDVGGVDGFAVAVGKAEASEFLTVGWPNFNIDWLLKPANFTKLMEGNYDNKQPGPARTGIAADFAKAADMLRGKQYHGL